MAKQYHDASRAVCVFAHSAFCCWCYLLNILLQLALFYASRTRLGWVPASVALYVGISISFKTNFGDILEAQISVWCHLALSFSFVIITMENDQCQVSPADLWWHKELFRCSSNCRDWIMEQRFLSFLFICSYSLLNEYFSYNGEQDQHFCKYYVSPFLAWIYVVFKILKTLFPILKQTNKHTLTPACPQDTN